jgi:hypothetical protein
VKAVAIAAAPTIGLSSGDLTVCFKTEDSTQTNCASPSTDNCSSDVRVIGCLAIVTASVTYTPITPVISLFWPSIALSSTSVGPIDYVCPSGSQTTCP